MTLAYDTESNAAPLAIAEVMQRMGLKMAYAKDEEIFAQDEDADMVHMVVQGAVRTTRLLADGRRQIGAFYYPGDLIGLETGAVHRFSAEAICDSVVLVVRRGALRTLVAEGQLDRAIWEATRRELERTQDHLLVLGRKTACEKVASFLMGLAQREGAERISGPPREAAGRISMPPREDSERISMPMSRQDMADYLGLTIETVSRMLTQLQGQAVVEFDGCRKFKVKRWDALEEMAA